MYYITSNNFIKLLDILKKKYEVYVPEKKGDHRFYKKYEEFTDNIVIDEVRSFEPLKSFFTLAREVVAKGFSSEIPHSDEKPFCIVGVKACDLKGFKIQDYVFNDHDYADPFYIQLRERNLIISADCTCTIDTCFCTALELKPYPQEDFDINLSFERDGFLVEVGSKKGEEIVESNTALFVEARDELVTERDKKREDVIVEVEKNIKENQIPKQEKYKGIIEENFDSDIWQDEAKTCVECGACNTICPTCHCFFLYDQKSEKRMERFRTWDSCMLKHFARVAGGANARPKLWERLRNRFEKKFDFFPKVAEVYACTGCGRCVSACPAKIDIRAVLKGLVESKP